MVNNKIHFSLFLVIFLFLSIFIVFTEKRKERNLITKVTLSNHPMAYLSSNDQFERVCNFCLIKRF